MHCSRNTSSRSLTVYMAVCRHAGYPRPPSRMGLPSSNADRGDKGCVTVIQTSMLADFQRAGLSFQQAA